MFGKISSVKEFQVVQVSLKDILVILVPEEDFDERQLNIIESIIHSKSHDWNVEFKFVDSIEKTNSGKYKFIVSELNK
jgi:phenylacetate-CoA ligase